MVSKVARTNPAKVASSRAGRTSPVSKVVSNADLKIKGPAIAGPLPYVGKFISTFRQLPLPD